MNLTHEDIPAAIGPTDAPCPACGEDAYYVRELDRYVHQDGARNDNCWAACLRSQAAT